MDLKEDWLDSVHIHKLKKNRVELVRDLLPDPVCDYLLAEYVISQEEYEQILYCNQTTAGRNRKLLDILATKGPNGFNEFRTALLADFKWLVDALDSTPPPPSKPLPVESQTKSTITPQTSDVTDEDIDVVVQSLLTSGSLMSWKFVARKLGFKEDKLNEIEYRSPRDIRAQIYEMLFYWRLENTYRARHGVLCDVLVAEGRIATAEMLRRNHMKKEVKLEAS
ncbi:death domain-containing protein CRADD-like [Watersipora subatra]|uniref:death domain-containing protein CRADD-like n=1 Tax=Watersipora subatra TaxID=2589382 RepID=UPI00355C114C